MVARGSRTGRSPARDGDELPQSKVARIAQRHRPGYRLIKLNLEAIAYLAHGITSAASALPGEGQPAQRLPGGGSGGDSLDPRRRGVSMLQQRPPQLMLRAVNPQAAFIQLRPAVLAPLRMPGEHEGRPRPPHARAGQLRCFTITLVVAAVCGGLAKADKHQVQHMVRVLLNMDHTPKPDDAADALAIALCHAQSVRHGVFTM